MLTMMLASALLAQGGKGTPPVSANELIGKMFARYSSARTLTGTVKLVQSAAGASVTVESLLQYERPSKIYLRQVRKSSDPFTYVLSSDGKHFTYDAPDSNLKFAKSNRDRIQESIEVPQADPTAAPVRLNIGDMYAAAAFSLGDRSAPFDIAIGRIEDLRFLTGQWPALSYQGITELRGERVHVIHGHWRPSDAVERATGQFELYISETFDLRRYVVRERAQLAARSEIAIVSDWSVNLLVGGKPDPNLFKLVL